MNLHKMKMYVAIVLAFAVSNTFAADGTNLGTGSGASPDGVAVGANTTAGQAATAVGANTSANNNTTAVGSGITAAGQAVIVGRNSSGDQFGGVFGNTSSTGAATNAWVIGNGITATRDNELALGGKTIGGVVAATQADQAVNLLQMNNAISTAIAAMPANDPGNAIQYDTADRDTATLAGPAGTELKNVAAGTTRTSAANVSQVNQAHNDAIEQSVNYTDGAVAIVQAQTDANTGAIAIHTGQIAAVQTGLVDTNAHVASVQSQTTANTGAIATQAGQIAAVQTGLADTNVRVATAETKVAAVENGLVQTNTKVAAVEIQTNANTAAIVVQGGQITAVQNGLVQTNTKVAQVEAKTDNNTSEIAIQNTQISGLQNDVGGLQNGLAQTNNQVANNTRDISRLDGRVSGLEKRMDGLEGMAKRYAYSAAAMGLAAAGIVFDPRLARQIGMGAATVNGKSAMAIGVAVRHGNAILNMKIVGGSGMSGAAVGATWGY